LSCGDRSILDAVFARESQQPLEKIMKLNPYLVRLFDPLPMAFACDLYQRLREGKRDMGTRDMLLKALDMARKAGTIE
jgi:hypothetical protein